MHWREGDERQGGGQISGRQMVELLNRKDAGLRGRRKSGAVIVFKPGALYKI